MRIALALLAAGAFSLSACDSPATEALMSPATAHSDQVAQQLPFHADVAFDFVQVPLPPGRCTKPLPEGMAYLWMTRLTGTATATHLGNSTLDGTICIYGLLTDPTADPPANGTPVGWQHGLMTFTAANGDRLIATCATVGISGEPGTPGWTFLEEGALVGGTGRFRNARGQITGSVDPVAQTATYDGWIRYGR